MNPGTSQTISIVIAFIGALLVAIGTFGNHYYGRKIIETRNRESTKKESTLNAKIESLIESNKELGMSLEPFKDLATAKFPQQDIDKALESLRNELSMLHENIKKTVFRAGASTQRSMPDGTFQLEFELTPIGDQVIPIFTIESQTQNGAVIKELEVLGPTLPGMSYDRMSKDGTAVRKEYRSMYPGKVHVRVVTDRDPGNIRLGVDPWDPDQPASRTD